MRTAKRSNCGCGISYSIADPSFNGKPSLKEFELEDGLRTFLTQIHFVVVTDITTLKPGKLVS
jgi:hypothetical protein